MKAPMSPRTGKPVREVIAVYGSAKIGKSTGWRDIAEYENKTGADTKFWVIDTDGDAADRLLAGSPHLTNMTVLRAWNWETFKACSKIVQDNDPDTGPRPGDWIVIDLADRVWKFAQNYYNRMVFLGPDQDDDAEYLLKLRADWEGEKKKGGPPRSPIEGWDWGYINGIYDAQMLPILLNSPAHIYLTTEMADYSSDLEKDKTKRMMFGKIGTKMTGQKSLPYQVATILFLDYVAGKRVVTTVGDRDGATGPRPYLNQEEFKDMVSTYLLGPAGWQLA